MVRTLRDTQLVIDLKKIKKKKKSKACDSCFGIYAVARAYCEPDCDVFCVQGK